MSLIEIILDTAGREPVVVPPSVLRIGKHIDEVHLCLEDGENIVLRQPLHRHRRIVVADAHYGRFHQLGAEGLVKLLLIGLVRMQR